MFNIQFLFLAVGIVCLLLILSAIRSYLKFQKAKIELITFKTICEEKNSQIKNLQEKTSLLEKDKEELVKINGKLSATIENQNKTCYNDNTKYKNSNLTRNNPNKKYKK